MMTQKSQKIANKYCCDCCDYYTSNKTDYSKHVLTRKHKNNLNLVTPNDKKSQKIANIFSCICGKEYTYRQGLWQHKKKCSSINAPEQEQEQEKEKETEIIQQPSSDIMLSLLNQNIELQKQLIELCKEKNTVINNTTNTTNNTTNNQFNLQFFLNETCKDALNIDDFVKQIKLQLSDLDMIGRVGYVNGMSKIIIRNLNELDVCKRPIHCTDLKRETLYVKDNNAWEKEKGENIKLKKAIKGIECKNIKQIPHWVEANPTSEDTETKKHLEYHNIVLEVMGGSTLEDDNKKHEKIIRNVAKEVTIDKTIK